MVELLLEIVLASVLLFLAKVLFVGPGQLLLVLFKQRKFSDEPDGTAVCLSIAVWLILGLSIWLIVAVV